VADSLIVRAGSREPIDFFLTHDSNFDGRADAAIDLSTVNYVDLRLQRTADNTVFSYKTSDATPLLSVISPSGGHVRFTPLATTWSNSDVRYNGFFMIRDLAGRDTPVPEGHNMVFVVQVSF
jgi:hypothetical protein